MCIRDRSAPKLSIGLSLASPSFVAVSFHAVAGSVPPLSLITVFFSVRFGGSSSFVRTHTAVSPSPSAMDDRFAALPACPSASVMIQLYVSAPGLGV